MGRKPLSISQYKKDAKLAHKMWKDKSIRYTILDIANAYKRSENTMQRQISNWRKAIPGWFLERPKQKSIKAKKDQLARHKENASLAYEMWISENPRYSVSDIAKAYNSPEATMYSNISKWRKKIPGWFLKRKKKTKEEYKKDALLAQGMWVSEDPRYSIVDIAEAYGSSKSNMQNQIVRWRKNLPGWFELRDTKSALRDRAVQYIDLGNSLGNVFEDKITGDLFLYLVNSMLLYVDAEGGISAKKILPEKIHSFAQRLKSIYLPFEDLCRIWGYSERELEEEISNYLGGYYESFRTGEHDQRTKRERESMKLSYRSKERARIRNPRKNIDDSISQLKRQLESDPTNEQLINRYLRSLERAGQIEKNVDTAEKNNDWASLIWNLQNQDNDFLRQKAVLSLGIVGHPAAIPALIRAIKEDPYIATRLSATGVLGEMNYPSEEVISLLVDIMENNEIFEMRKEAIHSLGSLRHPESISALVNSIDKNKKISIDQNDSYVHPVREKGYIVFVLGEYGTDSNEVVFALMEIIERDDLEYIKIIARTALGKLGVED